MQEKIIILRKKNNWTQKFIADYLGVATRTYTDKELGNIEFKCNEMFKLADLFKLPIEDIFIPAIHRNGVVETKKETNS